MTKLFRVMPKRVKCNNGIVVTPYNRSDGNYIVACTSFNG